MPTHARSAARRHLRKDPGRRFPGDPPPRFPGREPENILAKTGLTKGALYYHFPDKNRLGYAVIEEVIRDRLDAVVFAPLRESDDPALLERCRDAVPGRR